MPTTDQSALTEEEAQRIAAPLYDALNRPAEKDVPALLAEACHDDYRSYHTNEEFLTRDQLVSVFETMGKTIPDLKWEVAFLRVLNNMIIVRGRATGTPAAEFWGAPPSGRSFKTMAIDLFTVREGKLARGYHIENWMTALEQMRG
jgi:predicted ester cyclase